MKRHSTSLIVIAVVVVVGVLVLATVTQQRDHGPERAGAAASVNEAPSATIRAQQQEGETDAPLARLIDGDPRAVGRVDAPVVMIEYSDFRCPFCGVFARNIKPELMSYVEDGTLRVEWRDFPVFGEQSLVGAYAGQAAAVQGRFWQWYQVVFDHAPPRGHLNLDEAKIADFARQAGIPDIERFQADRHDPRLQREVQIDLDEARRIGATGTPTFLINREAIVGAQPLEIFTEKIERLATAKEG